MKENGDGGERSVSQLHALAAAVLPIAGLCCLLLTGPAPAQARAAGGEDPFVSSFPVAFDSERIRLFISGDTLEVRGNYFLLCRRRTTSPLPLFYPFPRDSLLGGARMVSLRARIDDSWDATASWQELEGPSGVRWNIPPCTADTIEVEAVYRQKILTRYARYIVTTTRAWQRPLRHAAFEIHLPPGARPLGFSFPFVARQLDGQTEYVYESDDFFPDRDIAVTWEE